MVNTLCSKNKLSPRKFKEHLLFTLHWEKCRKLIFRKENEKQPGFSAVKQWDQEKWKGTVEQMDDMDQHYLKIQNIRKTIRSCSLICDLLYGKSAFILLQQEVRSHSSVLVRK